MVEAVVDEVEWFDLTDPEDAKRFDEAVDALAPPDETNAAQDIDAT